MPQWFGSCAVCVLVVLTACDSTAPPVDAGPPPPSARFAPPETGAVPFLATPFPNDLYLAPDGTVDIAEIPGGTAMLDNTLIELSTRRGFCRICTITFPIDGALDPASVPGDAAPEASASAADAIVLLRADGTGEPIPLMIDYHALTGLIVLRPRYGIVLDPETRYVAAITDAVRNADGAPLEPSPIFRAVRDGEALDAAGERARPFIEDALGALATAGVARERVVSATIFTTGRTDALLRELRAITDAAAPPTFTVDRVWRAGDLDALFGVPSEDRPGIDIPPADGVGERSIVHDAIAFVVSGTFDTPRVVDGQGTEIGLLNRDASGAILAGAVAERVPYVLVVPEIADPSTLPVVVVHHGLPAHKITGLHVGNTFARMGMAVLAYDAFQMGGRAASAVDEMNQLRGLAGADGLEEHDDADVNIRYIGLSGAAEGNEDRLDHMLGAVAQMVSDLLMSVRALREGDVAAIAAADPALATLSFDPDGVFFVGQSFGGFTGIATLPALRNVQAAAFFVGPPDATENICNSPANRATFEVLALAILGLRGEFESAGRRLCMTPQADLMRWLGEPLSPVATLHYALREPIGADALPDLLFAYATFDERLGNSSGEHVLGAAGIPVTGRTFFIAPPPTLTGAISANFTTPNGPITAAGWIFESDHSVIRSRDTTIGFELPFMPPFTAIDPPRVHENPIEDAHALLRHFFETRRNTGRAEIPDPATL